MFGESLVKPSLLEMVKFVCGSEKKKIPLVPQSNSVVHSRTIVISSNILQLGREIYSSLYSCMKRTVFLSTASFSFSQNHHGHTKTIDENLLFYELHLETSSTVNVSETVKSFYFSKSLFLTGRITLIPCKQVGCDFIRGEI